MQDVVICRASTRQAFRTSDEPVREVKVLLPVLIHLVRRKARAHYNIANGEAARREAGRGTVWVSSPDPLSLLKAFGL